TAFATAFATAAAATAGTAAAASASARTAASARAAAGAGEQEGRVDSGAGITLGAGGGSAAGDVGRSLLEVVVRVPDEVVAPLVHELPVVLAPRTTAAAAARAVAGGFCRGRGDFVVILPVTVTLRPAVAHCQVARRAGHRRSAAAGLSLR